MNALIILVAGLSSFGSLQRAASYLPRVPTNLPESVRRPLIAASNSLEVRRTVLTADSARFTRECADLRKGSNEVAECESRKTAFVAARRVFRDDVASFIVDVDDAVEAYTINSMIAYAALDRTWTAADRARLDSALRRFGGDPDPNVTGAQIKTVWASMLARSELGDLAREAAGGNGIGFPGAGTQSHEDCVIFSVATATGLPYGVVAARATALIREGPWREAADRQNPQAAIENVGVTIAESIYLSEIFGRVEVVKSSTFENVLKAGKPVMVGLVPEGLSGSHQVVLVKAFHHDGELWYAMMDSNQGPTRRLYLSAAELRIVLRGDGIAFRPDPHTTPRLLR